MLPKVTVLMPVYNGEKYLREAIESILNQSFKNFEFLIINDGSTDNSVGIINSFSDKRIKLIDNKINSGIVSALNQGIDLALSEYIARMDSDDISLKDRLSEQIKFMNKNPEIGILGSWVKVLHKQGNFIDRYYTEHEDIKASLIFNTSLAHPTVMLRKSIIDKHKIRYDCNYRHSEDYELWTRLIDLTLFANLPKVLFNYRKHEDSICSTESKIQNKNTVKIRLKQIKKIGLMPIDAEIKIHFTGIISKNNEVKKKLKEIEAWLKKLINANNKNQYHNINSFKKTIQSRWFNVCYANNNQGKIIWKKYWKSNLSYGLTDLKIKKIMKLFIKTHLLIHF